MRFVFILLRSYWEADIRGRAQRDQPFLLLLFSLCEWGWGARGGPFSPSDLRPEREYYLFYTSIDLYAIYREKTSNKVDGNRKVKKGKKTRSKRDGSVSGLSPLQYSTPCDTSTIIGRGGASSVYSLFCLYYCMDLF